MGRKVGIEFINGDILDERELDNVTALNLYHTYNSTTGTKVSDFIQVVTEDGYFYVRRDNVIVIEDNKSVPKDQLLEDLKKVRD